MTIYDKVKEAMHQVFGNPARISQIKFEEIKLCLFASGPFFDYDELDYFIAQMIEAGELVIVGKERTRDLHRP